MKQAKPRFPISIGLSEDTYARLQSIREETKLTVEAILLEGIKALENKC